MAKRRFQDPKPFKEGNFWWLRVWDANSTGSRKRQRIKLAPVTMKEREVLKIAEEKLRPVNQGLILTGSAMTFGDFLVNTYMPIYLPLLSSSTQNSYRGIIRKYLEPRFGRSPLRDLTRLTMQQYFSGMAGKQSHPVISKIRDTLSSVLRSAVTVEYLIKSPMEDLQLPIDKRAKRSKPTISPEQFRNLLELVAEPYASMIYTAVWTGLRVSELIGLRWRCIHDDAITIEERIAVATGAFQKRNPVQRQSESNRTFWNAFTG